MDSNVAWVKLLAAWQGDLLFEAYAKGFCMLANLDGAPERVLSRLFCASLPLTSQSHLSLAPFGDNFLKEFEAVGGTINHH